MSSPEPQIEKSQKKEKRRRSKRCQDKNGLGNINFGVECNDG